MAEKPRRREAWHPPRLRKKDARAIQAIVDYADDIMCERDPPSRTECKAALDWIIGAACATYDEPFEPGREDVRNYLLGRRSVGLAIIKASKIKAELLPDE